MMREGKLVFSTSSQQAHAMQHGVVAAVVTTVLGVLALIFVSLRCVARFYLVKQYGIEDVFAVLGGLFAAGSLYIIWREVAEGLGQHAAALPPEKYQAFRKTWYFGLIMYFCGITFSRLSILVQFLRIFVEKKHRMLTWMTISSSIQGGIGFTIGTVLVCSPIQFFWDKSIPNGKCLPFSLTYISSAFSILTDVVICVLPIVVVRPLTMPPRQRTFLIVIFSLGGFCCLTTVLRLRPVVDLVNSHDYSYSAPPGFMWSWAEVDVALICGALPLLTPIVKILFPNFLMSNRPATPHLDPIHIHPPPSNPDDTLLASHNSMDSPEISKLHKSQQSTLATLHEVDEEPFYR